MFLSGLFLGMVLTEFQENRRSLLKGFAYGLSVAAGLFVGIIALEKGMSEKALSHPLAISEFATLRDHCGVHAGRTLLSLYHKSVYSRIEAKRRELALVSSCRIAHFKYLKLHQKLGCGEAEDPIECRLQWMSAFAERGLWDFASRKFFYEENHSLWGSSKKEEAWIAYVLKDQELVAAKVGILPLLGLEENAERYQSILQDDETKETELTETIFKNSMAEIPELLRVTNPTPAVLKFRDTWQELQNKLSRASI